MNKQSKILLVEDEESLAIGLEFNLKQEGYKITWVDDGRKALESVESKEFDLIILDIMLPYVNGFEVAEKIRVKFPQMPILILTAKASARDRVKGLEIGADDYLTKPFHLKELLLRVRGMLKRKMWYQSTIQKNPVCRLGNYEIHFDNLSVHSDKKTIQLTPREAMLLKYLMDREGKVVSRKELLENVWHIRSDVETRTVDNFIARLRKYLERNPEKPEYIKSIRSAGYMFTSS